MLLTTFNPLSAKRLVHIIWQDEIPPEARDRFLRQVRYRLPGANGRYRHNIPDLQITSPELPTPIRRQFTFGWEWKDRIGASTQPAQQDGTEIVKLRLMKTKADADFAIGFGGGPWGAASGKQPTLEQFR